MVKFYIKFCNVRELCFHFLFYDLCNLKYESLLGEFKNNDERFECYADVICIEEPNLNPQLNKIPTAQECDATMLNSNSTAGNKKK
jgi:hypothetical protein